MLRATAQDQGGYFTAKQAKASGYDNPHLEYHLSTGAFERIGHGNYRSPPGEQALARADLLAAVEFFADKKSTSRGPTRIEPSPKTSGHVSFVAIMGRLW